MATGILGDCKKYFKTVDLYVVLGVDKSTAQNKLKKAYYQKSLEVHPDRNESDSKKVANAKFQIVSKIYAILNDEEKRKIYDETGTIGEEDAELPDSCESWDDYWRLLFPKLTTEKINEFVTNYKGSSAEREDLANTYNSKKGDMNLIMEHMLLAEAPDEERLRGILEEMIAEEKIPAYPAFTKEPGSGRAVRQRAWTKERKDFEKANRKRKSSGGQGAPSDLFQQIAARQQDRERTAGNFLDHLAEKYGGPPTKDKKRSARK